MQEAGSALPAPARVCAIVVVAGLLGLSKAEASPVIFARLDLNGDARVDAADLALFAACNLGAGVAAGSGLNCRLSDNDHDGDVDGDDFGAYQRCFSGNGLALPDCAGLLNRFDFDGNGRVDNGDLAVFLSCQRGSGVPADKTRACQLADADGDTDVDVADFGAFQSCYNPYAPANPACPGLIPPRATLAQASGTEDTDLVITLTGTDPYRPGILLPTTITALPAVGSLLQFDGTPITTAPADVTDPTRRVRFRPDPDGYGSPYASLSYSVYSTYSQLASNPQTVSIGVANVNDPPIAIMPAPSTQEDTPAIFSLDGFDADFPNDMLHAVVVITPNRGGKFYQVDADGTPRPDLSALVNGSAVTNPDRKVYFVPPQNFYSRPGFPTVAFRYKVIDASGEASPPLDIPIFVSPVNDPPVATAATFAGANTTPYIDIDLRSSVTDVEVTSGDQSFNTCIDVLPQQGTLYLTRNGNVLSDPITQAGICFPGFIMHYARNVGVSFGCDPDPSAASYPLIDTFSLHMNDGIDNGNVVDETLRTVYFNTPPVFTGPMSVDVSEDSSLLFAPTATDVDGNPVWYYVVAPLPTKGTLYFHTDDFGEVPVTAGQPTPEAPTRLMYVPLPNVSTAGSAPDIIHIRAYDLLAGDNPGPARDCDTQIQVNITPVNDPPAVTAVIAAIVNISADTPPVVTPAFINSIHVTDDALATELLKVTLKATGDYAGHISLLNPTGLANVQQVSPKEIQIEGTLSSLNATFAQGIEWFAAPLPATEVVSPHSLVIEVNDQGHSGAENPPTPLTGSQSIDIQFSYESTIPFGRR